MDDPRFRIELRWSGTGREAAGEIGTDDLTPELSDPQTMAGRGVGTNPEELLVSAVASCSTATLPLVLGRAKLPVDSLAVAASGTVTGVPGRARLAGIVVSPTILGGDLARQPEYGAAARLAHDRCFIGRALAGEVTDEVGSVQVREAEPLVSSDGARPLREHADATRDAVRRRAPDARSAGGST